MKVAVIIARGNSQRIKNKNIKIFFGKPIIERTFNLLKSFKIFDKIILNTDSKKIIRVCSKLKFDKVVQRSKKLGYDSITTNQVIQNTIRNLEERKNIKLLCCVYPCSPLIEKKQIIKAMNLINKKKDFVFPVIEYPAPIEQALMINKSNSLSYLNKRNAKKNTKIFKRRYFDAGQFYLSSLEGWNSVKKSLKGFVIPKYSSVDIDDIDDWNFAKFLFIKKGRK
jgi:pseudaminic acid cytidylyltransferase